MATSGPAFVVRRAKPADADAMLFVWQETAGMLAKGDSRFHLTPDAPAQWQSELRGWLVQDDVAVFVAESLTKPDHILGYIVGMVQVNAPTFAPEPYGFVSDLAVDSHAKAGRIGRELFDALKLWFHERGVAHIEARVPTRHAIAQAFWRALGATELYEQMWLKLE